VPPKVVPAIVTEVPTEPEAGDRLVMAGETVKLTPGLEMPATVTTTLPVVAPLGTGTAILVALQLVGLPVVPLNLTVLLPWEEPNFVPVIAIEVPTGPIDGDSVVMPGVTVNAAPLLATPPTVTTTFPDVALLGTVAEMLESLQAVAAAVTPLKDIVFDPWLDPKLAPEIVTAVPVGAELGTREVMVGFRE